MIIQIGPLAITVTGSTAENLPKNYVTANYKKAEKTQQTYNSVAIGISSEETSRIAGCKTAKEIWYSLELTHEGTKEVKRLRIDMFMQQYESFKMKKKAKALRRCLHAFLT